MTKPISGASSSFAAFRIVASVLAISTMLTVLPPSVGQASAIAELGSIEETQEYLAAKAGGFEDQKDVKCWTSFRQLETFVAGRLIEPAATHKKSAVVANYVDQIWRLAAASVDGASVGSAEFDATIAEVFPMEHADPGRLNLRLGEFRLELPYQSVEDYLATVEPIRLIQNLVDQVAIVDPARSLLSKDALDSTFRLVAILSSAVLVEANRQAIGAGHETIGDDDVAAADRSIAEASNLETLATSGWSNSSGDAVVKTPDAVVRMLGLATRKIESLRSFNTSYSKDVMGEVFKPQLGRLAEDWAGMPVSPQAVELVMKSLLPRLAGEVFAACVEANGEPGILTGSDVLATLARRYPRVTTIDGRENLFPAATGFVNSWAEEAEGDALRDSGAHWKAIHDFLMEDSSQGCVVGEMDLYALEELSEFLSTYPVHLFKSARALALERGLAVIDTEIVRLTDQALEAAATSAREKAAQAASRRAHDVSFPRLPPGEMRARLAGSFDEEIFSDVTDASGIDFVHQSSERVRNLRFSPDSPFASQASGRKVDDDPEPHIVVGIAGGGVAVGDVDGDGRLDIYLVSGVSDRLYRNVGDFQFEDITEQAGLLNPDEGRGAYFVDYDNDGDQDLFVTHVYAPNRLYENDGYGKFADVSEEVGLPLRHDVVTHSAVWFDLNNDGFLDVYLGNYGDWVGKVLPKFMSSSLNATPNQIFLNRGGRRFEDATEQIGGGHVGWTHAVSHFDVNNDGWQDLYLANDFGPDALFLNEQGRRLVDATPPAVRTSAFHGMSVGFTDHNNDGLEDVYVANIAMFSFRSKRIQPDQNTEMPVSRRTTENLRMIENNQFLVSGPNGLEDRHHSLFELSTEGYGWAWDADFFDFDNDGNEDLYVVNGREPYVNYGGQRNVLLRKWKGRFYDVSLGSGADQASNGRGAVYADLDSDGDLDLVVNNFHARATILRNNLREGHWVRFRLVGSTSSRDAVGAVVRLHTGGTVQARTVRGGSGFLSKEPSAVHFGLGSRDHIDKVEILWPAGGKQTIVGPAIDREHEIAEKPESTSERASLADSGPTLADFESGERRIREELQELASRSYGNNPLLGPELEASFRTQLEQLPDDTPKEARARLQIVVARTHLWSGNNEAAIALLKEAVAAADSLASPAKSSLGGLARFWLAVAYLRDGEQRNCIAGHTAESCIIPLAGAGIHTDQSAGRAAMRVLEELLEIPDLDAWLEPSATWLFNIASMTVGDFPQGVPPHRRAEFFSEPGFPRFREVADLLGLAVFDKAGGVVVDDLNGDGYLDVLFSTSDHQGELRLFLNEQGRGFRDATTEAGLNGLPGGLNMVQADYDNDGDIDVFVLRGAWLGSRGKHPNSLLRNDGNGTFSDVTYGAGLGDAHYPTQTGAWADYDLDGHLDLYIGNETGFTEREADAYPDQLFRNNGDGTFTDTTHRAGLENRSFTKAVVWGDIDNDRYPDLFVSNLDGPNQLYLNRGNGTFDNLTAQTDLGKVPMQSFGAWFWDYDNDGAQDLFVTSYAIAEPVSLVRDDLASAASGLLGRTVSGETSRLWRGDGEGGFTDVTDATGLARVTLPMGHNFGDLDNDGFLDFYLATGYPGLEALLPNVMYQNVEGRRFRDVTTAGGFGHLQKGHGVAFGDLDNDGDQDVVNQVGGFYTADRFANAVYENPGFGRSWLRLELVGTESNRSAIGAQVRIDLRQDGSTRSIYRWVGSGGTFGCNPLRLEIGLGSAERVDRLEIRWPHAGPVQVFENFEGSRAYRITEGSNALERVDSRPFRLSGD